MFLPLLYQLATSDQLENPKPPFFALFSRGHEYSSDQQIGIVQKVDNKAH